MRGPFARSRPSDRLVAVTGDGAGMPREADRAAAQAEATPTRSPDQPWDWTPPPIPQPLPEPGGPIVEPVGAAPQTAAPAQIESPGAATPGATPVAGGEAPVLEPGAPAQPAATPGASPVASPAAQPQPAATISLTPDFRFDPSQVRIRQGQAVRWVNNGRSPQTVTANPALARDKSHAALPEGAQPFDSGVLNAGATYVHVFDVPGTYSYFSIPQEENGMIGRVIVE